VISCSSEHRDRKMSTPTKVCSDVEGKSQAEEHDRIIKVDARRSDAAEIKRRRPRKNQGAPKMPDPKTKERRQRSGATKKSIKRVREQRRIQHRKADEKESQKRAKQNELAPDHPGNLVCADVGKQAEPESFFWEVESVIGRRIKRGRVEYLIRWKGCSEDDNTWEPTANLCDTAMEEAMRYTKAQKLREKQREEDEKKLFGNVVTNEKHVTADASLLGCGTNDVAKIPAKSGIDAKEAVVDDHLWKWNDSDHVIFRDVLRIHVNDTNAGQIVKDARINGTPVVLVGHKGWANFAKRWLRKRDENSNADENIPVSTADTEDKKAGSMTDVASEHSSMRQSVSQASDRDCDLQECTMAVNEEKNEIFHEEEEQQNELNFTTTAPEPPAPQTSTSNTSGNDITEELLDLSGTGLELNLEAMIQDIGDEDVPVIKRNYNESKPIHGKLLAAKFLTTCWPNSLAVPEGEGQGKSANLYLHQWQFPLSDTAGRKLCHQNNPLPKDIMGEDLLKYWIDLPQCKLDSPLQYIFMGREDTLSKLHRDPGGLEISIAPVVGQKECVLVHRSDGSNCLYHLSASLDEIDLHKHPMLSQARIYRTVIEPGEILLMPYGTYHQCRNVTPCLSYSRFHLDTLNLLPFVESMVNGDAPEIDQEEVLWNLTSALIIKIDSVFDEVQSRVKMGLGEEGLITEDVIETVNILRTLRHFIREIGRRHEIKMIVKGGDANVQSGKADHNFEMLVDDIDMSLHEFRYRQSKIVPTFKPRRGRALKGTLSGHSSGRVGSDKIVRRDLSKFSNAEGGAAVAFNASLDNNYMSLVNADIQKHYPNASRSKVGESLMKELSPNDLIACQLVQKFVKAEVVDLIPSMKAVLLSFEDFPSIYDEWVPHDRARFPSAAEIAPDELRPGLTVIDLSNSNEYRAKILSIYEGPAIRAKLTVSQHEMTRLIVPSMILGRYVPPTRKRKTNNQHAIE